MITPDLIPQRLIRLKESVKEDWDDVNLRWALARELCAFREGVEVGRAQSLSPKESAFAADKAPSLAGRRQEMAKKKASGKSSKASAATNVSDYFLEHEGQRRDLQHAKDEIFGIARQVAGEACERLEKLGLLQLLRQLIDESSPFYDLEFSDQLEELRPDWFERVLASQLRGVEEKAEKVRKDPAHKGKESSGQPPSPSQEASATQEKGAAGKASQRESTEEKSPSQGSQEKLQPAQAANEAIESPSELGAPDREADSASPPIGGDALEGEEESNLELDSPRTMPGVKAFYSPLVTLTKGEAQEDGANTSSPDATGIEAAPEDPAERHTEPQAEPQLEVAPVEGSSLPLAEQTELPGLAAETATTPAEEGYSQEAPIDTVTAAAIEYERIEGADGDEDTHESSIGEGADAHFHSEGEDSHPLAGNSTQNSSQTSSQTSSQISSTVAGDEKPTEPAHSFSSNEDGYPLSTPKTPTTSVLSSPAPRNWTSFVRGLIWSSRTKGDHGSAESSSPQEEAQSPSTATEASSETVPDASANSFGKSQPEETPPPEPDPQQPENTNYTRFLEDTTPPKLETVKTEADNSSSSGEEVAAASTSEKESPEDHLEKKTGD